MSLGNPYQIPNFIKARSEQSLRAKFRERQLKTGKKYQVSDIVWTGKVWVLWYFDDETEEQAVNRALSKKIKKGDS